MKFSPLIWTGISLGGALLGMANPGAAGTIPGPFNNSVVILFRQAPDLSTRIEAIAVSPSDGHELGSYGIAPCTRNVMEPINGGTNVQYSCRNDVISLFLGTLGASTGNFGSVNGTSFGLLGAGRDFPPTTGELQCRVPAHPVPGREDVKLACRPVLAPLPAGNTPPQAPHGVWQRQFTCDGGAIGVDVDSGNNQLHQVVILSRPVIAGIFKIYRGTHLPDVIRHFNNGTEVVIGNLMGGPDPWNPHLPIYTFAEENLNVSVKILWGNGKNVGHAITVTPFDVSQGGTLNFFNCSDRQR